jgi:PadR family transcriptional regulator PadR
MARQVDNLQGTLDLLVLKTLAARGPLHGYGIAVQIESASDDVLRVEEGSLYPALHRMEQAGWIRSDWRASVNNRRAKYYEITTAGSKRLNEERRHWRLVVGAVDRVLQLT